MFSCLPAQGSPRPPLLQLELCAPSLRGAVQCVLWQIRSGASGLQSLHLVSVHFIGELVSYREELEMQHHLCWETLGNS